MMALRKHVILRSPRSGRLEGRTMLIQACLTSSAKVRRKPGRRLGNPLISREAGRAEHQQVAEAADAVVQRLDLVVHVVGRAGETGAALDQLFDRRGALVD